MQFTTSTNMNLIHDESLEELKKQICEPGPNPKRTLNLAAGIAKELYQIEAISPDEYQLLSRYLSRAMKSPSSPPKFPEFAPRAELHPVTISEMKSRRSAESYLWNCGAISSAALERKTFRLSKASKEGFAPCFLWD